MKYARQLSIPNTLPNRQSVHPIFSFWNRNCSNILLCSKNRSIQSTDLCRRYSNRCRFNAELSNAKTYKDIRVKLLKSLKREGKYRNIRRNLWCTKRVEEKTFQNKNYNPKTSFSFAIFSQSIRYCVCVCAINLSLLSQNEPKSVWRPGYSRGSLQHPFRPPNLI